MSKTAMVDSGKRRKHCCSSILSSLTSCRNPSYPMWRHLLPIFGIASPHWCPGDQLRSVRKDGFLYKKAMGGKLCGLWMKQNNFDR
jgi:hypothetical protein